MSERRILKYDLSGKYLYGWGERRTARQFSGPRQITTDRDGNLYVAEVVNSAW